MFPAASKAHSADMPHCIVAYRILHRHAGRVKDPTGHDAHSEIAQQGLALFLVVIPGVALLHDHVLSVS
jgi:hypothetical protein